MQLVYCLCKKFAMKLLVLTFLLAISSVLVIASSLVQFYESGIRFESNTFPDWFIGFYKHHVDSGKNETELLLIEDGLATVRTLWYIEHNVACGLGFYIRSHNYPKYHMTLEEDAIYLSRNKRSCFILSAMQGGTIAFISSPNFVGLDPKHKTLHYIDPNPMVQAGRPGKTEMWKPRYNGEYIFL